MVTLNEHAGSWLDMEPHTTTLTALAREATTAVEFGVRGGVSTWAILDGLPPDGRLVSVDVDPGCPVPARVRDDPRWTFIVGDDRDPALTLPSAEFVFIDTSHTYDHTRVELEIAKGLGARIIALHDYALPPVADIVHGFERREGWVLNVETSQWGLAILRRP